MFAIKQSYQFAKIAAKVQKFAFSKQMCDWVFMEKNHSKDYLTKENLMNRKRDLFLHHGKTINWNLQQHFISKN